MHTCIVLCFVLLSVSHASERVARDCTGESNNSEVIEGSEYSSNGRSGFDRCPRGIFDSIRRTISGIFGGLKKVGSNLIARLRRGHENPSNTKPENNNFGNFNLKITPGGEKGANSHSGGGSYIHSAENLNGAGGGSGGSGFISRYPDPGASDGRGYNDSESNATFDGRPRPGFSAENGTSSYKNIEDGQKSEPVGGDSIDNMDSIPKNSSSRDSTDILDKNSRKVFSDIQDTLSIEFGNENETLVHTKCQNSKCSGSIFNSTLDEGKDGYDGGIEYSGNDSGKGHEDSKSDGEPDSNDNFESVDSEGYKSFGSKGYAVNGSDNKGLSVDLFFTRLEGSGGGHDGDGTSIQTKGSSDVKNAGPGFEGNLSVSHVNSSVSRGPIDDVRKVFNTMLGKDFSPGGSLIAQFGGKNETSNTTFLDGEKNGSVVKATMDSGVHKSISSGGSGSILDDDIRKVFGDMPDTLQSMGSVVGLDGGNSSIEFGKRNEILINTKYQNDKYSSSTFNSILDDGKGGYDDIREYSGDGNGEGSDTDGERDSIDSLESADSKEHEDSSSEGYTVSGSGNKELNFDLFFTGFEGSGRGCDGDSTSIHTKGSSDEENIGSGFKENGSGGHINNSDGEGSVNVFQGIRKIFSTMLGKDHSAGASFNPLSFEFGGEIETKSEDDKTGSVAFGEKFNFSKSESVGLEKYDSKSSGEKYSGSLESGNPGGNKGSDKENYGGSESWKLNSTQLFNGGLGDHDRGKSDHQGQGNSNDGGISVSSGGYGESHSGSSDGVGIFKVSGGDGSDGFVSNLGLNSGQTFGDESDTNGNNGGVLSSSGYSDSSSKGVEYDGSGYGSSLEQGGSLGGGKSGYGNLGSAGGYVKSSNFGCTCLSSTGSSVAGYGESGSAPGSRGSDNEGFKVDSGSGIGGGFGDRSESKRPPPLTLSKSSITPDETERYSVTSGSFGEHKVVDISGITGLFNGPTSGSDTSSPLGWYYGGSDDGYRDTDGGGAIRGYNGPKSNLGGGHEVSSDKDFRFFVEQEKLGSDIGGRQDVDPGSATEGSNVVRSGDSYGGGLRSADRYGGIKNGYGLNSGDINSRSRYGYGVSSGYSIGGSGNHYGGGLSSEGNYRRSGDGNGGGLKSGGSNGGSRDSNSGGFSTGGSYQGSRGNYGGGLSIGDSYEGSRGNYGGGLSSGSSYERRGDDNGGGFSSVGSYGESRDSNSGGFSSGGSYGGSRGDYGGGISSGDRYGGSRGNYGGGLSSGGSYGGSRDGNGGGLSTGDIYGGSRDFNSRSLSSGGSYGGSRDDYGGGLSTGDSYRGSGYGNSRGLSRENSNGASGGGYSGGVSSGDSYRKSGSGFGCGGGGGKSETVDARSSVDYVSNVGGKTGGVSGGDSFRFSGNGQNGDSYGEALNSFNSYSGFEGRFGLNDGSDRVGGYGSTSSYSGSTVINNDASSKTGTYGGTGGIGGLNGLVNRVVTTQAPSYSENYWAQLAPPANDPRRLMFP